MYRKKLLQTFLGVMGGLCVTVCAFANNDPRYPQNGIHLDQSKDVYFDQFSQNQYSLQLLQAKNKFTLQDLILGGSGEFDLQHWGGNKLLVIPPGAYTNGNGFYLTQMTFDAMANVSEWTTGFISVSDTHVGQNSPQGNYIYLPHAFFVFGNVDRAPVYLTFGINTIPFGVFTGGGAWDTPLTANYFLPSQAPQLSLAYFKNGLNAVATAYSDETNHDNIFAYSVYYTKSINTFTYSIGASYLTDLKTNSTGGLTQAIRRSVPGFDMGAIADLSAGLQYKIFGLNAEYVRGGMSVGLNRANPNAMAITVTVTPKIANKDTTFGLTHSKTNYFRNIPTSLAGMDAVPLAASGLKSNWSFSVSRNIFVDFINLGLNLQKSITYSNLDTYTGTLDLTAYL